MNNKVNKKIKKNIKSIKETIMLDLLNNTIKHNTNNFDNDLIVSNIYNQFENELIEWLNNNYQNRLQFGPYGEYLVNKYLSSNLDKYESSYKIREYRKYISKIIDELVDNKII